jgi:hypothetical protein
MQQNHQVAVARVSTCRRKTCHLLRTHALTTLMVALLVPQLHGQEPAESDSPDSPAAQLAERQRQVAKKYEHLEQILLRMSELSAASDPRRAALVTKAVAESKQRLIGVQFASLIDQLGKDELSKAMNGQEKLDGDLAQMLELLLSENRSKRLASEKARIRQYLQQLNRIINQQKSLQARTTGGAGQPGQLSEQQGALGEQTGGLADEIRKNEDRDTGAEVEKDADSNASEQKPGEGEQGGSSQKPSESSGKGPEGGEDSKAGDQEATPSENGPSESQGGGGEPGEQSPDSGPQSASEEAHPARQRLEGARQRMKQAQEELKKAEREGAGQEQEAAIRQLQQAKAELERILRQLREEEIEQVLIALEARLVKMLRMQRDVYQGTTRLDKASADGLTHEQEIEAGRLSSREAEIVVEADKALMLLRDDGSAVAMPEALSQAHEDMQQVVARLAQAKVGQVTLAIEEDIVSALNEMLEAVRQAMEDAEQRRQNEQRGPRGQQGAPKAPVLVDALAELRMIRSLQLRVNTRTQRYGEMITGKHAEAPELLEALIRLAERQERVYRVTSDLEAGKNR